METIGAGYESLLLCCRFESTVQSQLSTFTNRWYTGGTLVVHWWLGTGRGEGGYEEGVGWEVAKKSKLGPIFCIDDTLVKLNISFTF